MQPRQYRAGVCCLVLISHLQEESCSQCVKVHLIAVTFFSKKDAFQEHLFCGKQDKFFAAIQHLIQW